MYDEFKKYISPLCIFELLIDLNLMNLVTCDDILLYFDIWFNNKKLLHNCYIEQWNFVFVNYKKDNVELQKKIIDDCVTLCNFNLIKKWFDLNIIDENELMIYLAKIYYQHQHESKLKLIHNILANNLYYKFCDLYFL